MKSLILFLVTVISTSAFATGGTWCEGQTLNTQVQVSLSNSRMIGAPVLSGTADFETVINGKKVQMKFDAKSEMPGYWSMDRDLKMLFYKELYPEDTNGVDFYHLQIDAKIHPKTYEVKGKFKIVLNDRVIDSGSIECELE